MKYRITIEEVVELEKDLTRFREVYQQVIPDLDLQAVIAVVNGLEKPFIPRDMSGDLCKCGHSRRYHREDMADCGKCLCPWFHLDAVVDPNPLDKVNYKDGE